MENRFYLADRVQEEQIPAKAGGSGTGFEEICTMVRSIFDNAWKSEHLNAEAALSIQKRAIIGY